ISAICSAMPRSKAGGKCSGRIRSKGGNSNGVSQASKNGLSVIALSIVVPAKAGIHLSTARKRISGSGLSPGRRLTEIGELRDDPVHVGRSMAETREDLRQRSVGETQVTAEHRRQHGAEIGGGGEVAPL